MPKTACVTGAWGFSGRYVAPKLIDRGWRVVSLTGRTNPRGTTDDPYGGAVRGMPYSLDIDVVARRLEGCKVLAANLWSRHDRPPVGHRGPWLSHLGAVHQSAVLLEGAKRAGVKRIVWTSITNPGLDPDLPYFAGKAVVEQLVRGSGIPYAILRPACFFGHGGILIENIAWAARNVPVMPVPEGEYRMRPIHVDDYADLVADACEDRNRNYTVNAVGPDRVGLPELVDACAKAAGTRCRTVKLGSTVCKMLYAGAGRLFRETILTGDEIDGLRRNRLDTDGETGAPTSLLNWIDRYGRVLGTKLAREPMRSIP